MRISDPVRFANRVVIPAGIAVSIALFYMIAVGMTILVYGAPITLVVLTAIAMLSLWLANKAHQLKQGEEQWK